MAKKKIMTKPWAEMSILYNWLFPMSICCPGAANSALIIRDRDEPTSPAMIANIKYNTAISLQLVEKSHLVYLGIKED